MGFISWQVQDTLSSTKRPNRFWGPLSLFDGKWRSSLEIKQSGYDVDHSPSSRAEVKEKAELKFPPPVCLHRMHRYRFTLTFHGAYSGFPNYKKFHVQFQQVLKSVTTFVCVLLSYVYFLCTMWALLFFTLDAGLLARSQYSEGPATGHLDTGFSWFPCA